MLTRINSPETRATIKNEVVAKILYDRGGGDPKNVFISRNSWNPDMAGKNLAELDPGSRHGTHTGKRCRGCL